MYCTLNHYPDVFVISSSMSKTLTSRIMKSTLQSSHRAFCLQTTSAHRADVVAMIDSFIVHTAHRTSLVAVVDILSNHRHGNWCKPLSGKFSLFSTQQFNKSCNTMHHTCSVTDCLQESLKDASVSAAVL